MTPKDQCEILLDALLNAAEALLKKNGEFYPIGAVLTTDEQVTFTAADLDNAFPASQSVINSLIASHKQMAETGAIKTSGIAWDATITTPNGKRSDAIIVSLEHKDNYSVIIAQPYKVGLFKQIKFGEIMAQMGNNDIF